MKISQRLKSKGFWQAFSAVVFFVATMYLGAELIAIENIQKEVASAGIWGPLAFIVLKLSTIVLVPLPGNPIYLAAVPLFGVEDAYLYIVIGDMLGYCLVFLIGRVLGKGLMRAFFTEEEYIKLNNLLHRVGTWKGFALVRITFFGIGDVISYGAGLTPIPILHYILITVPIVLIHALIIVMLGEVVVTNTLTYILAGLLSVILPLGYLAYKHLFKKENARSKQL